MKVWKFRQYRNDGSARREERVYRYITPSRAASSRYRRDTMPVCTCCGERYCGWNMHDLRSWELAALGLARDPVESRKVQPDWRAVALGLAPEPPPLICHQHGRFYHMARAGDIECVPSAKAAMSAPLLAWEAWLEVEV